MAALDYLKEVSVGMGQVITGHVLSGITLFLIAVFSIKLVDNISPNSNYFKSFAKGFYYNLKGDKDAELRCNEEIIKNLPSRKGYFDLASSYSQKGNLDEALEAWSHGFRLSPVPTNLQKMFQTIGILFANPYIKHYKAYLKQIRKKSEEVKNYIDLSMLHMNLNNIDESLAVQEQMRERFPERADSRALYALMLGGLGRQEEAKEKWGETVGILLKGTDASLKFRKIGESVNDVLEYSPSKFFKNSILFKKNHLNDLEDEVMLTGEAMKIVKDAGKSDVYFTTEPISIFNYEDRHAYVMKRDPGKLLYDIQERTDAVYRVADYLALIHAKMNVELTKKGRVNIPKTLEEKLGSRDLNLPEHIITKIKSNYAPVFDSLKNATYVFNKDAHPEQWLVREDGGIVAIDWEDKGLVPMQFDL
ncbi:MAG: hypothetical protein NT001_05505, partial [Candidatus Woesearchaeota archaeon]|nr:hypothetical protein [Candidatus Woesearchaeota archaeon]